MDSHPLPGEHALVLERVVVAPAAGQFHPREAEHDAEAAPTVTAGETIGFLELPGETRPVATPFAGRLMGMLAHPGERVRPGQPLAWLRVA
jgi:biotin carboxyl carrier protein